MSYTHPRFFLSGFRPSGSVFFPKKIQGCLANVPGHHSGRAGARAGRCRISDSEPFYSHTQKGPAGAPECGPQDPATPSMAPGYRSKTGNRKKIVLNFVICSFCIYEREFRPIKVRTKKLDQELYVVAQVFQRPRNSFGRPAEQTNSSISYLPLFQFKGSYKNFPHIISFNESLQSVLFPRSSFENATGS